ncbi:MAG: amidohydrolase family protein [Actinomycetota bacterium]|nr:amidohydrolase family protein [Actinomycetota bacterium]
MAIEDVGLIDHHCHGLARGDLDRPAFESRITESFDPAPKGASHFDQPLGLAIRRWCAPLLDLEPFAEADEYVARRRELGAEEVARRFLEEAGLAELLIDTGYRSDELYDLAGMAKLAAIPAREVVRLEAVAEAVARSGVEAARYPEAFSGALAEASSDAVGFKTIVAYRGGFAFDPARPSRDEVVRAAGAFLEAGATGSARIADPVLLRHGIWAGADLARERGMPIQFHVGWGDPDLVLHLTNPTLLTGLIRELSAPGVDVALLHCYPFHREAAYLSVMYPNVYFDVGSALHYHGPSAPRLLAEAMEVAPFTKLLFSTDAFAVAEQYYLGSMLFRRALGGILDGWIAAGECDANEADRIAELIGRGNAMRIYPLEARQNAG